MTAEERAKSWGFADHKMTEALTNDFRAAMSDARQVATRFWMLVDRREPSECWPRRGDITEYGYGRFFENKKAVRAHRYAFFLANGFYPPVVMHACDNRPCVNPNHLRAGTWDTNNKDTAEKGRTRVGEDHAQRKLNADQVKQIIEWTGPKRAAARVFGVDPSTIRRIKTGKTWTKYFRKLAERKADK